MAYKFQLGTARLSGSVIAEGALSGTSGVFDGGNITNVGTASIQYVSASVQLVGAAIGLSDASGLLKSGGGLEDDAGEVAISTGGVTNLMLSGGIAGSKLADGAVGNTQLSGNISADKLNFAAGVLSSSAGQLTIDAGGVTNNMLSGAVAFSKLASLTDGNILVGNGSNVAASVAVSGDITISNAGVTAIGSGKVTNTMLSGAIAAGNLQLGDGLADSSDILVVDLNTSSGLEFSGGKLQVDLSSSNALALDAGGLDLKSTIAGSRTFSNDVTVNGNFTVLGSTFSASVGTLLIEDAEIVIADGASALSASQGIYIGEDTSGTPLASFKVGDALGTNDAFVSSLNLSAPNIYSAGTFATDDWTIDSTHISGNLPVSASAFYGDGSNLSNISADSLALGAGVLTGTGNITSKLTRLDSAGGAFTATLPGISSADEGTMYVLKALGSAASNNVTISPSGSQKIDGAAQSIVLESDFAAVTLFVIDNGGTAEWIIV